MIGNVDGVNNDYIQGWAVDVIDPTHRVPLEVFYDGELFAHTVAGFPRADLLKASLGDGRNGFYVALPLLTHPADAEISVSVAGSGEPIGEPRRITRRPRCSPTGLLAHDMLKLQATPLHSMQGLAFDGETLTITGIHLPPDGNPFDLSLHSTTGTSFEFLYPLHSPGVGDWYWYWPNATWSAFQIKVDLAACTDTGPHFDFWFETGSSRPEFTALDRNHLRIPKDMGAFQNFPGGDQLTRVQRFDSSRRVAIAGYSDHRQIAKVAEHYGLDLSDKTVLDWGCGHGRVIRHFADQQRVGEAWGVDIDPENVRWLQENIPSVRAETVPLMPPTDLPEGHFDLVYAISVMTHLTEEAQDAWLRELKRITKPGGLVMLTFAGPSSVAFASRFLNPEWLAGWTKSGFDDTLESQDLNGKIGDDTYYRNTKQSPAYTRESWGRYFEVVDIHDCAFGYQDLAILRNV